MGKIKGFVDGGSYGFYDFERKLCLGTLHLCEKCETPASVNAMKVLGGNRARMNQIVKSAVLFERMGYVIGELCATEDGFYLCEDCYGKHDIN